MKCLQYLRIAFLCFCMTSVVHANSAAYFMMGQMIGSRSSSSGSYGRYSDGINAVLEPILVFGIKIDSVAIARWSIEEDGEITSKFDATEIMHSAAKENAVNVMKYILSKGISADGWISGWKRPLIHAMENNAKEVFELLLAEGADVNLSGRSEDTPLRIAAIDLKNPYFTKQLLKYGADLNETYLSRPIIERIAEGDSPGMVKAVLDYLKEEDMEINGLEFAERAIVGGATDVLQFLYEEKLFTENDFFKLAQSAIYYSEGKCLPFFLSKGLQVNKHPEDDYSLLRTAAGAGKLRVVKLLLRNGANINQIREYYNDTALDFALRRKEAEVAHFLIQKGALAREKTTIELLQIK